MPAARKPEDLDVWRLAWELKNRVHAFSSTLPASRDLKFCDEIRRASRSGPDNVSEGFYRFNPAEFHRFLNDARASLGEVRNQLMHAQHEGFISETPFQEMFDLANRAIAAATGLQAYLRTCPRKLPRVLGHPRRVAEPGTRTKNPRT